MLWLGGQFAPGWWTRLSRIWSSSSVSEGARNIPICGGGGHPSCLVDGDTGWEQGVKWRIEAINTPEIGAPQCDEELQQGLAARRRLQQLMAGGYRIGWQGRTDPHGRRLVDITLADGRDAGQVLIAEGLARRYQSHDRDWCRR